MTAANTEDTQSAYERDGFYIHAESVLSPEVPARAAEGLEAVRAGTSDTGELPASGWGHKADLLALTKIEQPQLACAALREALASPRLGEVAAAATGAAMVQVWWVQGLVKPGTPGGVGTTTVGWHQDKTYWSDWEDGSELFTAWLALSDVTEEAGPMVFVPGSHRWGLLPGGDFFAQDQESLRALSKSRKADSGGKWLISCPPVASASITNSFSTAATRTSPPDHAAAWRSTSARTSPPPNQGHGWKNTWTGPKSAPSSAGAGTDRRRAGPLPQTKSPRPQWPGASVVGLFRRFRRT